MEDEIKKDGVLAELKKGEYFHTGEQYYVDFKYDNEEQKKQVYRIFKDELIPAYGAYSSRRLQNHESIIMPYYVDENGEFTLMDYGIFGGTSLPEDLLPLFIQRFVDADKMTILIGDKKIQGKFDERQFNELLADMEKQNSKLNEQEENTTQSPKENNEDTEIFDKYSTCVEALKDKCNDENFKDNIYLNNEIIKHYVVDNLHVYEHSKTGEIVIAQDSLTESQLLNNEVKESQMSFHYNEQREGYECELTIAGDAGRISYGDNNLKPDLINDGRDYAYLPTSKYYGYEFQKDCEISSKNLKDDMKTLLQNALDNAETEELKKYYSNALNLEQAVELEGANYELSKNGVEDVQDIEKEKTVHLTGGPEKIVHLEGGKAEEEYDELYSSPLPKDGEVIRLTSELSKNGVEDVQNIEKEKTVHLTGGPEEIVHLEGGKAEEEYDELYSSPLPKDGEVIRLTSETNELSTEQLEEQLKMLKEQNKKKAQVYRQQLIEKIKQEQQKGVKLDTMIEDAKHVIDIGE